MADRHWTFGGYVRIAALFWGNHFRWIGHLPGDIRIEKENFRFYFPLTTMVILSLLVNVVVRLVRWSWQWMN